MTRLLYGTAAVLVLGGLGVRLLPARVAADPAPGTPGIESQPNTRRPVPDAGAEEKIVTGNIFSISRSAPRVRYTPPDLARSGEPRPRRPRPVARGLRLFGTVAGMTAVIDADPAIRGAEIYQIGDVVDGKRITVVAESTVVLEGPAGRTILRMQPLP